MPKPPPPHLLLPDPPRLDGATLILALSGWMDGGHVSTGTVEHLMSQRKVRAVGHIDPDDFYIHNFPGDMETSALFRPNVKYEDGVVTEFEFPQNIFHVDESAKLAFFVGKEPNLKWQRFADCLFEACEKLGVKRIVFIGSFGGAVPHTRDPRMYGAVSHPRLRDELHRLRVRLSDYEGPGSFSTLLLHQAEGHKLEMLSFVAEIPGYLQGPNPLSIEAVARRLGAMLNLSVDLGSLRAASNDWEAEVSNLVDKDEDLARTIRKLEEDYDNALIAEEI